MSEWDRDVFFFAGRFHEGYFTQSFLPYEAVWENNFILGGGYQQFFARFGFVRFGVEAGLADRFTTNASMGYGQPNNSIEAWTGFVARFDGWDLGPVHITPAITGGVSLASGLVGVEAQREQIMRTDPASNGGQFLFYIGPELDFSLPQANPNLEVFWRLQHRSGAFGSVADLDGANADTLGVRWKF